MANLPDYDEDDLTGADCAGLVTCETLRRVMPRQLTLEERIYEDAMQEVIAMTPMM